MMDVIRVLLVDDDEDDFNLTQLLLLRIKQQKFVLEWASSFERAVTEMERAHHDIFLIDYRLGNHDGLELLSRFGSAKIPIIMLTGDDNPAIDLKAMQLGAMDYLIKGRIDAPLLERSIRYSIVRKRTEEQLRETQEQLEERVVQRTAELTWANDELDRSAGRSAFLADAGRVLASSLDFQTTLANLAKVGASAFPDAWCLVDILYNGRIERLQIAHSDPDLNARGRKYTRGGRELAANSTIARVIRLGKPEVDEVTAALFAEAETEGGASGEEVRFARELNLTYYMAVPLICRGQTLGTLSFVNSKADPYTQQDVRYAELLADRAAVALDNSRLYTELEKSDRLKDEFLATMSHELRTPLTPILGWGRMIKDGSVPPAQFSRAIDAVVRNAELEVRLVEEILEASRIVSGKLQLDFNLIDITQVLKALIVSWKPVAEAKGIVFSSDIQAVPQIWGNAQRLEQVFANLLSNSVKFTASQGRIAVSIRNTGQHVQIKVSDTGIGIKPDFLPYVFERFRQADGSTTRKHGGLGLGLAIVRHLVEMHGGRVMVESQGDGKGATFSVSLPIPAENSNHSQIA